MQWMEARTRQKDSPLVKSARHIRLGLVFFIIPPLVWVCLRHSHWVRVSGFPAWCCVGLSLLCFRGYREASDLVLVGMVPVCWEASDPTHLGENNRILAENKRRLCPERWCADDVESGEQQLAAFLFGTHALGRDN